MKCKPLTFVWIVLNGPRLAPADILDQHAAGCLLLIDPPCSADDERALRDLARQRECFVEALCVDQRTLRGLFLAAIEERGDAALAAMPVSLDASAQVEAMANILDRVGDHEIAHQRLAAAARRAAQQA